MSYLYPHSFKFLSLPPVKNQTLEEKKKDTRKWFESVFKHEQMIKKDKFLKLSAHAKVHNIVKSLFF